MNDQQLDQCYQYVLQLTKEAGEIVKEGYYGNKQVETKKGPWDLVTDYDRKVEKYLIDGILRNFPDHEFVAEESSAGSVLGNKPTWIIDPIDGTTNFVFSFPMTCISIALCVNKKAIIGIVYNPILDQMFTARLGKGAELNGKKIETVKETDLSKSVLCLDIHLGTISHHYGVYFINFDGLIASAHSIRSLGSAAMSLSYVGMGAAGGYVAYGLQSWDLAAGVLIIQEAGGYVCNADGSDFDLCKRSMIVASGNKGLAENIVNVMKEIKEERNSQTNKRFKPGFNVI